MTQLTADRFACACIASFKYYGLNPVMFGQRGRFGRWHIMRLLITDFPERAQFIVGVLGYTTPSKVLMAPSMIPKDALDSLVPIRKEYLRLVAEHCHVEHCVAIPEVHCKYAETQTQSVQVTPDPAGVGDVPPRAPDKAPKNKGPEARIKYREKMRLQSIAKKPQVAKEHSLPKDVNIHEPAGDLPNKILPPKVVDTRPLAKDILAQQDIKQQNHQDKPLSLATPINKLFDPSVMHGPGMSEKQKLKNMLAEALINTSKLPKGN